MKPWGGYKFMPNKTTEYKWIYPGMILEVLNMRVVAISEQKGKLISDFSNPIYTSFWYHFNLRVLTSDGWRNADIVFDGDETFYPIGISEFIGMRFTTPYVRPEMFTISDRDLLRKLIKEA